MRIHMEFSKQCHVGERCGALCCVPPPPMTDEEQKVVNQRLIEIRRKFLMNAFHAVLFLRNQ